MQVDEEKKWAIGLNSIQFKTEWMKRFPRSDYMPDQNEWLGRRKPESRLIDGVKPEDYKVEVKEPKEKPKQEQKVPMHCQYCGVIFDVKKDGTPFKDDRARHMAKVGHERRCKQTSLEERPRNG